jgi:hypothetical protein
VWDVIIRKIDVVPEMEPPESTVITNSVPGLRASLILSFKVGSLEA